MTGLYHVTNNLSISKYELLKLFKKFTQKNIEIKPFDEKSLDKSLIDTRLSLGYKIPSSYEYDIRNDNFYKKKVNVPQYKSLNFD